MGDTSYTFVYVTAPTAIVARRIAKIVLEKRLAACANIFRIESTYWWKGKIEKCPEYAMFLKTKKSRVKRLTAEIKNVHPYEVPCIVSLDIVKGNPDFLKWIGNETQ
jgi:periplasmic divalent cation tolerance protein